MPTHNDQIEGLIFRALKMRLLSLALLLSKAIAEVPFVAFGSVELPLTGNQLSHFSGDAVDSFIERIVGLDDTHVFIVDEVGQGWKIVRG